MFDWVRALLDSTDIIQSPASSKKHITPPPKFDMPALESVTDSGAHSTRRSRRSVSPAKSSSPKKIASPRKPRQSRAMKESLSAASTAASATLQSALETAASVADTESIDGAAEVNGDVDHETPVEEKKSRKESRAKSKKSAAAAAAAAADEKVKVKVETTTDVHDDVETTQTTVSVEMPASLPDLPAPADTEEMIAQAQKMVEEATKLQQADSESGKSPKANKKRKTDILDAEDEDGASAQQPAKKAKVLTDKLRRERVRNRALVGVTATLALAYV
jgi:hypothetical protein